MSALSLYDSLTGKVLEVRPLTPGHLQIYVCGMTVYDDCHIGHARSMLVFDVLVRILRQRDWKVTYVRNITDVDDRIIERAQLRSISASALVAEMTLSMHQDFEALGILPPDIEPKATASIAGILALIERLMANNMAYQSQSGTVWFRVKALPEYGQLSSRQHNQDHTHSRQTGSQIEEKEDPRDFALWKAADARDHSVGTVWDSPWGKGRPGWHIECSAMSMEHLGSEFDLHGGGLDLLFPHHENELAQSQGAGCAFARHWMHVAPLRMSQEKMSKSLGNVIGIKTALAQWHPETIRHSLLSAHYRSPLDFSEKRIEESRAVLNRWYSTLESNPPAKAPPAEGQSPPYNEELEQTLLHDLNLPALMSQLSNMAHTINRKGGQPASKARLASELLFYGQQIGLLNLAPHQWFQNLESHSLISPERIAQFIIERNNARMDKDYAAADHIRQQLLDQGVELLDRTDGTDWRYLKT